MRAVLAGVTMRSYRSHGTLRNIMGPDPHGRYDVDECKQSWLPDGEGVA